MSAVDEGVREIAAAAPQQSETYGILVAVRDSGPGIDLERRRARFRTPFYTTKSSGVGMDCRSAESIIGAHGRPAVGGRTNQPRGVHVFPVHLTSIAEKEIHEFSSSCE